MKNKQSKSKISTTEIPIVADSEKLSCQIDN